MWPMRSSRPGRESASGERHDAETWRARGEALTSLRMPHFSQELTDFELVFSCIDVMFAFLSIVYNDEECPFSFSLCHVSAFCL